jgi:hypothetical protein
MLPGAENHSAFCFAGNADNGRVTRHRALRSLTCPPVRDFFTSVNVVLADARLHTARPRTRAAGL